MRAPPRFRALKSRPKLTAKLTVRLGIDTEGTVKSATDERSPNPDPTLLSCVLEVARSLRFEPSSDESSVALPLSFAPPPP